MTRGLGRRAQVGPFHNPSEAYSYYTLPFCKGHDVQDEVLNEHKKSTTLGIGEAAWGVHEPARV